MLLVPSVSQKQVLKIADLRSQGMTYKQVARTVRKDAGQVARYERLLERYGIEAFAK